MSFKVLVVDDSKLARMAVAKVMRALQPDWTRVEAANGDEALAALEEQKPDLVVLDFNMPGRDGLDVAAELRRMRPAMPVAVISANHQQEVVDRATAVGATFLSKPLTEQALRDFLASAVRQIQGWRAMSDSRCRRSDELELDALTELVNLGVSKAALSLREMIGEQVLLSVPSVDLIARKRAIETLGKNEPNKLVAVHQVFEGRHSRPRVADFPGDPQS